MNLRNFIPSWLKRDKKVEVKKSTNESAELLATKIVTKKTTQTKKKKFTPKESVIIDGITFSVGDKVMCRSNEPHPLWVGKIVEFWDNEGTWERPVPRVRNTRTGKIWGVNGVIKPFSEELFKSLKTMRPLEQWNSLVPKEAQYTEDEMKRKEESFKKKVLPKKK